jgi:hypothetical protein
MFRPGPFGWKNTAMRFARQGDELNETMQDNPAAARGG